MTQCKDLKVGDVLLAADGCGNAAWLLVRQDDDSVFLDLTDGTLSYNSPQGEIDTEFFEVLLA